MLWAAKMAAYSLCESSVWFLNLNQAWELLQTMLAAQPKDLAGN